MIIKVKKDIDNLIYLVNGTQVYITGVSNLGQAVIFGNAFCGLNADPQQYVEVVALPKNIKRCAFTQAKTEIKKGKPICVDYNLQKVEFNQLFNNACQMPKSMQKKQAAQ